MSCKPEVLRKVIRRGLRCSIGKLNYERNKLRSQQKQILARSSFSARGIFPGSRVLCFLWTTFIVSVFRRSKW